MACIPEQQIAISIDERAARSRSRTARRSRRNVASMLNR